MRAETATWFAGGGCRALQALGAILLALLTGCSGLPNPSEGDESAPQKVAAPLINGVDTRLNYGDHTEPGLMSLARWSTAAMMPSSRINGTSNLSHTFNAPTLQQAHNLCDGQPFAAEQTAADCAATLIDRDLVVTAAHCITPQTCADTRFVFGYWRWYGTGGYPSVIDAYSCQSIVVSQASPGDWAIVRLNQPVSEAYWPAPVRTSRAPLTAGLPLFSVGFPDGTPEKLSAGNFVTNQDPNVLVTNVDAFAHSDGASLFTDIYELAGVITNPTQGAVDYVPGPAGSTPPGCNVAKTCPDVGCSGSAPSGFYIGPALDAYCALDPSNPRLCRNRNAQPVNIPNPGFAHSLQTVKSVFLEPGATIDYGTCVTPGSSAAGDTYVALIAPNTELVSDNDNGGGTCGLGSHATYTVPRAMGGLFMITGGCGTTASCGGTIAHTISGPTGGSFGYSASNTNGATAGTRDVSIPLRAGETLTAGSCGLDNTGFTGDTYLRLFSGATELTSNDDACGGVGSQLSYKATSAVTVTLKAGCYASGACDARVSYRIGVSSLSFTATNTDSNSKNSVNQTLHLVAGDKLTVGTCGLQDAVFNGDTVLGIYSGTTAVAANDDSCGSLGSRVTYRAPATGDYSVHIGCFGSTTCSGTAVFRITPANGVNGTVAFSTSNTNNAISPSVHQQFYLRAGDIFSTGTCPSLLGASGTGDTFIRLYGPTGADLYNSDDNCTAGSSLLSAVNNIAITPETAGAYLLHMGCYANGACTGNEAYILQ